MAQPGHRLPHNVDGEFFVTSTCIDCDTCRQVAPASFARAVQAEKSYVFNQPGTPAEQMRALMALVACPTGSIGSASKLDPRPAMEQFPERILENVYYCGFADASSFGASSYLIQRPDGNVLVDSPRAARPLFRRLHELGGVRTMFLTHRDDVGQHAAFRAEFKCERVIHRDDLTAETMEAESVLEGRESVILDEDLLAIPVPGHTKGSMALLFRDKFLFTGDTLWWSPERKRLHASREVCWFSWVEQVASLRRLLDIPFECVLPGHGRRFRAASTLAMHEALMDAIAMMA